jgi:hypothetical protein
MAAKKTTRNKQTVQDRMNEMSAKNVRKMVRKRDSRKESLGTKKAAAKRRKR